MAAKIADSGADSVKTQREKILAHKNTDYSILAIGIKLSETLITCVDATEFLSDVYKLVHERKTHKALGNSDSTRGCDGIFERRVQSGTRA